MEKFCVSVRNEEMRKKIEVLWWILLFLVIGYLLYNLIEVAFRQFRLT